MPCRPGDVQGARVLKRVPKVHRSRKMWVVSSVLGAEPRDGHFPISSPSYPDPLFMFKSHLMMSVP